MFILNRSINLLVAQCLPYYTGSVLLESQSSARRGWHTNWSIAMTREEKKIIVVQCAKLGQELPALDRPPFPGPLGERIYNNISKYAYSLWNEQATLLINHYGLNLADPRAQEFLFEQMEAFLFDEGEGAPITGGAPGKGGAPQK
jgi:Fe-S cluster biosynthesis and repair protein YggX